MPTRVLAAAALLVAALLALGLLRLARLVASYTRIMRGLSSVPEAPHGHWLLGHVLPLLHGTPWDLMAAWVAEQPPLVKLRILQRHLVVVGSAEGVKRVFQVCAAAPQVMPPTHVLCGAHVKALGTFVPQFSFQLL